MNGAPDFEWSPFIIGVLLAVLIVVLVALGVH